VTGTSGYARSMPALGFDPAPGDVGSVNNLARQYTQVAAEVTAVHDQVAGVDLAPWTGKAGDAVRARQTALAQALAVAADGATRLGAAASCWSPRLSDFQAEADALERQAADVQATHQYLATKAPAAPALAGDLAQSGTALSTIRAKAQQLHQEYLSTAAGIMNEFDLAAWWDSTEDIRKYPEGVLAVLDTMTADHWLATLERLAAVPGEWVKQFGDAVEGASAAMADGKSAEATELLLKAAKLGQATGENVDAWYAFAPRWLGNAADGLSAVRGASTALGVLGILGDATDMISPQNKGTLGWVDRGVAATNAGFLTADLIGADLVMDAIPGVGEVAIAVTGLYLAGDFLYQHWTPFHDAANDVGHATVAAVKDTGHATAVAATDIEHTASSAWHSVTSSVGSWF
jgi:hypothetical protein